MFLPVHLTHTQLFFFCSFRVIFCYLLKPVYIAEPRWPSGANTWILTKGRGFKPWLVPLYFQVQNLCLNSSRTRRWRKTSWGNLHVPEEILTHVYPPIRSGAAWWIKLHTFSLIGEEAYAQQWDMYRLCYVFLDTSNPSLCTDAMRNFQSTVLRYIVSWYINLMNN